jgi:hypothetical protein
LSKKITALLVMGLIVGSIAAPAAQARPFAGLAVCNTDTFEWPGSGSTACRGTATGVDVASPTSPVVQGSLVANVDSYGETCTLLGEPPLIGTANGTLEVNGNDAGTFSWTRVGVLAILNPAQGDAAAVAAFVPHFPGTTIPTCAQPQPITATVAGLGALGL